MNNCPWFPSLSAFEHYDIDRSHYFPKTKVEEFKNLLIKKAPSLYPSGYNMVYLDQNNIFIYGGGYGNVSNSIGAFISKIDPKTLNPIWYTQLINTEENDEWDYPGVTAILRDGIIYVIYGYRLSQIDPKTGTIINTLILPSGQAFPSNTAYNGFDATPNGILVAKCIFRPDGCTFQGPEALVKCNEATPPSIMVSIKNMQILDTVQLSATVSGRITSTNYKGKDYIYLFVVNTFVRYLLDKKGKFTLDESWNPGNLLTSRQTSGSSIIVMNDFVVAQCNASFSYDPLSVIAVSQKDSSVKYVIQPFKNDPINPLVKSAYNGAISFMPSSVSVLPKENIVFAMDSIPGRICALKLKDDGFCLLWKVSQYTTEFIAVVNGNNCHKKVIVSTSVPKNQIVGFNTLDSAVFRDAFTGKKLTETEELPAYTSGSMIQPYYHGQFFYMAISGELFKLKFSDSDSKKCNQ
jgi:hypothetical protein